MKQNEMKNLESKFKKTTYRKDDLLKIISKLSHEDIENIGFYFYRCITRQCIKHILMSVSTWLKQITFWIDLINNKQF